MNPMSINKGPETRLVRFKQILVVDQDEAWALVMRDAVARGGFCVVLATTIEEAVRLLREQPPDLTLVSCLLDLQAAQALLFEIETQKRAAPVVLVGYKDGDSRWEPWRSRPFVTVIPQPFKSQDVLNSVRTLLDSSWEDPEGESPLPTSGSPSTESSGG